MLSEEWESFEKSVGEILVKRIGVNQGVGVILRILTKISDSARFIFTIFLFGNTNSTILYTVRKKKKAYLVSVHLWSIEHDPGGRRFHMEERLYHPVLLQCREVLH